MKNSEIKKAVTKGDIVLIFSIIFICAFWFLSGFIGEKQLTVRVFHNGEAVSEVLLEGLDEEKTVTVGGCEIHITNKGAYFHSSSCPDSLCVKRGLMKRAGDVMACVPNRVTVEISGADTEYDGIAY